MSMVVGTMKLTLRFFAVSSLKGKRSIVKKIVERSKNSFNASVSETGLNDVLDRAEIGFALCGNDSSMLNSKLDKLVNFVDDMGLAEITNVDMEIISL